MMVPLLQVVVAVHCSFRRKLLVIVRGAPTPSTPLTWGGGSPGALWGSLVNLSDLG